MFDIYQLLKENTYPGRGILIGTNPAGTHAVIAYFIMGRSVNSRNRVFVSEGSDMKTQAFDPAKLSDPSLIIYYPVRAVGDCTVVTNGDQTDTVRDALVLGGTFESALRTRRFEPDAPNFTPRISGIVHADGSYKLSILKSADGNPEYDRRYFFEYGAEKGVGQFIHTYRCDGNPIPSFAGEPETVAVEGDIDTFAGKLWDSLNEDNKVSLFVRYIELSSGKADTRIINKNK